MQESKNTERVLACHCQCNVLVQPNHPRPIDPNHLSPNNDCHPWQKAPLKNMRTERYHVIVLKRIPRVVQATVLSAPRQGWRMNYGDDNDEEESEEE